MSEMEVKTEVRSGEIRRVHTLFVEGTYPEEGIDPVILKELFDERVQVYSLGGAHHIESAAQALSKHHPDYYFLIDRDHRDDEFVDNCWNNFPHPEKANLLVWRKREIENYFIDPDYLSKSNYLKKNADIASEIRKFCNHRLFLDIVNRVIVSIREDHKSEWIKCWSNPSEFKNYEEAEAKLVSMNQFHDHACRVTENVQDSKLKGMLRQEYERFSGNEYPLQYGKGDWLNLVSGKEILNQAITQCFDVKDQRGNTLQGKDKSKEVVRQLIRLGASEQPQDFQDLRKLIMSRISG
jgi:hypothetical protein